MIDLVLDCDPGNDDAVAILAAIGHPALALHAVTTTFGHLDAGRTAENAAATVAAAGRAGSGVPVCHGAERPLRRERMVARQLDFRQGLDALKPGTAMVALDGRGSAACLADAIRSRPGLVIATTGPLTNIATLLAEHADLAGQIGRIVSLCGAWGLGTKTPAAEWNILSDPDAADQVFRSRIPLTIIPAEAAATHCITPALIGRIAVLPGGAAALAAELLASLARLFRAPPVGPTAMPLNDPSTILYLADPGIAQTRPAQVQVDTREGMTYGRTVFDFAAAPEAVNATVVIGFDMARADDVLIEALRRLA